MVCPRSEQVTCLTRACCQVECEQMQLNNVWRWLAVSLVPVLVFCHYQPTWPLNIHLFESCVLYLHFGLGI